MTVRVLGPGDADAVQALRLRGLRESPEAFGSSAEEEADLPRRMIEDRLRHVPGGDTVVVGAVDEDGALLGIGTLHRESKRKARHRAGIYGMYVAPEARGRGLGRALLRALLDHARAMEGLACVELSVTTVNTPARELYRAFGFVPYGIHPDAYRTGGRSYDAELMTLALDSDAESGGAPSRVIQT